MSDQAAATTGSAGTSEPGIERGTYEIIRDRLLAHGRTLADKATSLNGRRLELFGGTEMAVIASERIRTDNNCVPRDIVAVGDRLLFGYNVFIGLKSEATVADVLSLHRPVATDSGFEFKPVPAEEGDAFLAHPQFVKEFHELYQYYKSARLTQLRRIAGKLLAVFQIGEKIDDIKVFRWAVDPDGRATYIDNRGERDHVFPPAHDFVWTRTGREHQIAGRHPHVSIEDEVFVETVGGDLTIKIEDNSEDGRGIYREPVDDANQSLDDAEIHYARVGTLILLKILPYRESTFRYLVFSTRSHRVARIDAIGQSCVQLPEDHGIVFPGGYCLQSGETKQFDGDVSGMEYLGVIRSPNGEDVLYVFLRRDEGSTILFPYNLIRKEVTSALRCHGYSLFDDGRMILFRALSDEPTRIHPMQVWQTPFASAEHAARAPSTGSYLEKVGNAELVRGISDALSIRRMVEEQEPTRQKYEDLVAACSRVLDAYYWLDQQEVGNLQSAVKEVQATAELIIDEFEKVEALRAQAADAVEKGAASVAKLFSSLRPDIWTSVDQFVDALAALRSARGHLITLRELRYVDRARIEDLENGIVSRYDGLSGKAVDFLLDERALEPYHRKVALLEEQIGAVTKVADMTPLRESMDGVGSGLELLTEVVGGLKIDDATLRTRILEGIAEVMAALNRVRALVTNKRSELLHSEGVAEFAAQFNLFSQSVTSALALADTPARCDDQLSRLMMAIEELEGRFGEFDEFLAELATKREEVYEALSARKQILVDQQQRRTQNLMAAAERILQGIVRRSHAFTDADQQNSFFASDPMVLKLRELGEKLRKEGDSVRADEIESRVKSTRQEAARSLRDRQDIYEDGAQVIKLGRHRFSVNTQPLEMTMVPRDGRMELHLTGTDFFAPVTDASFAETRELWSQELVSESAEVYRGEYLACSILTAAEAGTGTRSLGALHEALLGGESALLELVREAATKRYDEGYARGVHDRDAALILARLLSLRETVGLLRFAPTPRAWAGLFWAFHAHRDIQDPWERHARSLTQLRTTFSTAPALADLAGELARRISGFLRELAIPLEDADARIAGAYLVEEIAREPQQFVLSAAADELRLAFLSHLEVAGTGRNFADDLQSLRGDLPRRYAVVRAWVGAFLAGTADERLRAASHTIEEVVVAILTDGVLSRELSSAAVAVELSGLLGQHPRIQNGKMTLRLDEILARVGRFASERVPAYRRFQGLRHTILEQERKHLRLEEFKPRVMSSFVRNRLINEVYLPLIGGNLAKQIGAQGATKRTDLMGMLLLISPPGYGKTTLMEYVANRLGLVFMKVNGPALGHGVTSLDPAEAPNATARQEVEKINLALEMGNNVLLYLDDIQHTHPELLQKFISLCDAQRKIEGVWRGETRTYDLKGKKFCVCMAGNPYTESGERFQIPDMLANRADIYNLGDILDGKDELFALSYIENTLTSSPVLAPLTTREPADVAKLVRMAAGEDLAADQLAHDYSSVELGEILAVLKRLLRCQQLLLKINQLYIRSASQDDAYRTEPPFRLQGSYRNMNKLSEKVVAAMNDAELEALIDDHYRGEAQTLTTGAEENLLKLAELRGRLGPVETERWAEVKRGYVRVQAMGGKEDDPVTRVTGQLGLLSERLDGIGGAIAKAAGGGSALAPVLAQLGETLAVIAGAPRAGEKPSPHQRFIKEQADLIDATLIPLLRSMAHKLKGSSAIHGDRRLRQMLPKLEYIDTLDDLLHALAAVDEQDEPG